MLQKFFFLLVCVACSWGSQAQQELPSFITDSLDTYLTEQQELWKIPGLAVAIIKDGEIVASYTKGVTDYTTNQKINEETLFMIGSNTKAFTAVLTATLAEETELSLRDPVKKWLPYFELKDPYLTEHVNIVDILSHRVGFQTFQGDFLNFDNELQPEEIIRKFALIEPVHEYRETWGYFNTGYTIAGEIIEAATGKPWEVQLRERIFQPLGMANALARSEEIITATNAAKAHSLVDGELIEIPYGDIDATAPAGSISASLNDMNTWVKALLNNGKFQNEQVIPMKALEATMTPRSLMGSAKNPFKLYGLGWFIEAYEGHRLVMHTGGIHGFVSSVTMVPSENLGVVILTNTDSNYLFEGLKYDLINPFLERPVARLSAVYHPYFQGSQKEKAAEIATWKEDVAQKQKPSAPLKNFTGRYENEVYGWVDIKRKKDDLVITFEHHKELAVTLSHTKDDAFLAVFNQPMYGTSIFPFTVTDGTVEKFTLKLDRQIEETTYDFYKK